MIEYCIMDAFVNILKNVIIFVALALPGYILVKTKFFKSSDSGILSKLLSYVGMPFLILSSTLDVSIDNDFLSVALISAVACVVITLGIIFFTGLLTLKYKGEQSDEKKRGIMRFAMSFSNNGFLGIPLALAVFPDKPIVVSIIVMLNILNNIAIYTFGVYLISGDKNSMNIKKAFLNPVVIAFILGLILNLSDIKNILPEVSTYSVYLKNIVTPISMIVLGMKLAEIKISTLFTSVSSLYTCLIKLVFLPCISVAIAYVLMIMFNLSTDIILAFFVAFATPTAALASTLADAYDGDTKNAVVYTMGTTVLSVATIPLLYLLLTLIV